MKSKYPMDQCQPRYRQLRAHRATKRKPDQHDKWCGCFKIIEVPDCTAAPWSGTKWHVYLGFNLDVRSQIWL